MLCKLKAFIFITTKQHLTHTRAIFMFIKYEKHMYPYIALGTYLISWNLTFHLGANGYNTI